MKFDQQGEAFEEAGDLMSVHSEVELTMLCSYCPDCNNLMIIKQSTEVALGVGNDKQLVYYWNVCKHCGKVVLRGV